MTSIHADRTQGMAAFAGFGGLGSASSSSEGKKTGRIMGGPGWDGFREKTDGR